MFLTFLFILVAVGATSGIYFGLELYQQWYYFFIWLVAIPIFYLLSFALYIVLFYIFTLFFSKKKVVDKPKLGWYFFLQQTVHQLVFLSRTKVVVSGLEKIPKGPILIVSNHVSMFDPMVVIDQLKRHPLIGVTKPENEKIPLCGIVIHRAGFIPIDRENNHNALNSIRKASDYIVQHQANIYICPEGTRSKTGELLPFHPGSFKIATRSNVDTVVCCIRNTNLIAKHFPFKRTIVYLDIVGVLQHEEYEFKNTVMLADEASQLIAKKLAEVERA